MRNSLHNRERARTSPATSGTWLIAIGLAGVLAAVCCANFPVATSVAILTLGATDATIVRYRRSPALTGMLLLHAAVYALLYCLFFGAVLHKAGLSSGGVPVACALDLAASATPILMAARRIVVVVRQHPQCGRP